MVGGRPSQASVTGSTNRRHVLRLFSRRAEGTSSGESTGASNALRAARSASGVAVFRRRPIPV